jgi:5S rRNA maturation endonuclease (ribonuclease M5)
MTRSFAAYLHDVDRLVEETPIDVVLGHYALPPAGKASGEYRMKCVFNEACGDAKYGNLTISLNDSAKIIYCHSCEVRGNLLTLIHGLERHAPPVGGKLRGEEFKAAVAKLREIAGSIAASPDPANTPVEQATAEASKVKPVERNQPLRRHESEAVRSLATLHEELTVDVERMAPAPAAYFRQRPWLTPEVCRKWGVGYLPRDGRSMFRGWITYTHRDERGEVISYSGRDANFEEKWNVWLRQGKPDDKKPAKHKYVKGYRRGLELYGQQAARLDEPHIAESLNQYGLLIVEGANDVIHLDALGVAAVGLCSNKATDEQVQKIVRYAKRAAAGRVMLLPDTDDEGESGFRDLAWRLLEEGITVRLGWSRAMFGGKFADRQPEQLSAEEWRRLTAEFSTPE